MKQTQKSSRGIIWLSAVFAVTLFYCLPAKADDVNFDIQTYSNGDGSSGPHSVWVGDFNNDGNQDFVLANNWIASISVYLGNGDGTFGTVQNYATALSPEGLAGGDLDDDGDLDMVISDWGPDMVSVMLNNGDGSFYLDSNYAVGDSPYSLVLGDFDNDNVLDIAAANQWSSPSTVSVLLGDGDGTFQPKVDYATGIRPTEIKTADFDEDGNLDLVTANSVDNAVSILLGDGTGSFAAPVGYTTGDQPSSVEVGDFNEDGHLDLVTANSGAFTNSVSILLGNGDGSFGLNSDYGAGVFPYSVSVTDLDGDGHLDIAAANMGASDVSVLLGIGDGTFLAKSDFVVDNDPVSIDAGDFDNNGKNDLVTSNGDPDSFSILKNINGTPTATPTITPFGKHCNGSQQAVSATTTTGGVNMYYTLNGSIPNSSDILYSGATCISTGQTFSVIAIKSGLADSAVASMTYDQLVEASGHFVEDFSTTNHMDAGATTANWDITQQQLYLRERTRFGQMNGGTGPENITNTAGYSWSWEDGSVLDSDGNLNVVWSDDDSGMNGVYFKKWNGSSWTKMDGTAGYDDVSNTGGLSNADSGIITLDSNDNPYVIWNDDGDGTWSAAEIYFSKWTPGTGWTKMDGTLGHDVISNSGNDWYGAKMAIDSQGNPYIVYVDDAIGNREVHFKKWTPGIGWTGMDGISSEDNLSSSVLPSAYPMLELGSDGNPVVAWEEREVDDSTNVYLRRWTPGIGWTGMDGISNRDNVSNIADPEIAYLRGMKLNSQNRPYVTWEQDNGSGSMDIYFSRWSGTAWTQMDGTAGTENISADGNSYGAKLIIDSNDNPNLAWYGTYFNGSIWVYGLYFTKWNGSGWVKMDGSAGKDMVSTDANQYSEVRIDLDSNDNPGIAWNYDYPLPFWSYSREVLFSKWTSGTGWTDVDGVLGRSVVLSDHSTNFYIDNFLYDQNDQPIIIAEGGLNNDVYVIKGVTYRNTPGSGQATSLTISNNNIVKTSTITPVENLGSGTIQYYLSNNGGVTWEAVTKNVEHTFSTVGSDLRWKATITDDAIITQLTIDWNVDYSDFQFNDSFTNTNNIDTSPGTTTALVNTTNGTITLPELSNDWVHADGVTSGIEIVDAPGAGQSFHEKDFARDSSGNPQIVWYGNNNGTHEVYFSKWNGSAWTHADGSTPGIETVRSSAQVIIYPKIAIGNDGSPMLIWAEDDGASNRDIYFTKYVSGTGWTHADGSTSGEEVLDRPSSPMYFRSPQIRIDQDGDPHVTMVDEMNFMYGVYYTEYVPGIGWTNADKATLGTEQVYFGSAYNAQMWLDASDNPVLVWTRNEVGGNEIAFTRWNGSAWTHADGSTAGYENISSASVSPDNPQFALDSAGRPNVTWMDSNSDEIFFTKWTGTDWTNADGISTGDEAVASGMFSPHILLDFQERPMLLWEGNYGGETSDIFFIRWNGSAWTHADETTDGREDVSGTFTGEDGQFFMDIDGNPSVIWSDWDPGQSDIYFSKWNGLTWTHADGVTEGQENVSQTDYPSADSIVVTDDENNPAVVWFDFDASNNWQIAFTKHVIEYDSPVQVQSNKLNGDETDIISATITADDYIPGASTIDYYLTNDGGSTWNPVNNGESFGFSSPGDDLRWRAILTKGSIPRIDSISVNYQTQVVVVTPTVSTNAPSSISDTSATVNGNVTDTGNENPASRVVKWGTTSGLYTNSCDAGSGGSGNYSCSITGLDPETLYYVRACATNSAGEGCGSETSFTTDATPLPVSVPSLTTDPVDNISNTSASGNLTITGTGGSNPTAMISWGTAPGNYSTGSCNINSGNSVGVGSYSCDLAGLTPETTYYVRASATNSAGTTDGLEESFTTTVNPVIPPVTPPTEEPKITDEECDPTSLSAKAISTSQINLKWKDNCDLEEGYIIERKDPGGSFEKIDKTGKNDESYQDKNLKENTAYVYRVKAYKKSKDSDYSNKDEATTLKKTTPPITTTVIPPASTSPQAPPATIIETPKEEAKEIKEEQEEKKISIKEAPKQKEVFFEKPAVQESLSIAAIIGLLTGAAVATAASAVPLFSTSPEPVKDGLARFVSFLGVMGKSRKENDWGVVFDTETRRPIRGAVVSMIDDTGKVVDTTSTDSEGRYGFLARIGTYTMSVYRENYSMETTEGEDEFYGDVYEGKSFEVKTVEDAVKLNIAMKTATINWKEFAKRKIEAYTSIFSVIKKDGFVILFYVGFIASGAILYFSPSIMNGALFAVYIAMLLYKIFFKKKDFGVITNELNKPVPFSLVSLYKEEDPARRVAFAVSDVIGRYYLLAQEGSYYMKVRGQVLSGKSFEKVFRVSVKDGIVNKDVVV